MDQSQISWKDFDKMHVIRRLRELVGRWWQIQINFTDSKGLLRGVPSGKFFNPLNPISQAIVGGERGFNDCKKTASQTTIESLNAKTAKLGRCVTGFSTLAVPIKIDDKFVGCVYGDGFLSKNTANEQKAHIRAYIERTLSKDEAAKLVPQIENLPELSEQELQYLSELVNLVVDEILLVNKHLYDTRKQMDQLSSELGIRYGFDQMIGKSSAMQALYKLLDRVCDSNATVLINGENGTGKELIAKALHYNSKRKKNKFLVVNCGAFNENLLESELFGHMKGSFTGAIKDKKGLFEAANGGTLFLDEIGDTSMQMQVKLLRVLQEGTYTPVGSTEVKHSNVRILAATNKDLQKMVKDGTFREDLFYRLHVINVVVPPLRDRKEDIPILSDHFLTRFSKETNSEKKDIDKKCLNRLMDHDWPGNVRELENEIERICVLAGDEVMITDEFLSGRIKEKSGNQYPGLRVNGTLKDAVETLEKQLIREGLDRNNWNKSKLAKELGISRAGLIMKVEKYGLEKRRTG